MFKDSRIYVAGHTGLLGSAIVKKLRSRGYNEIITRTHSELDLIDQGSVNDFFKKEHPEYVFLAAGLTGGIAANKNYPANFLHTNIAIQNNAFHFAWKYNVKHLIFYGSSCVYPKNCPQPMKEEHLLTGKIEETSEAYAIAKTAGIIACRSYNDQFKRNCFIALIPNSTYGPNDNFDLENSHVLSALVRRFHEAKSKEKERVILWGSGTPRREFIFSEDVADASFYAMDKAEELRNMHYNVGTGVEYSIKELAEKISKVVDYQGEIEWDVTKPDGAPRKLLDSSRFLRLGWKPSIDIEEGIKKTYNWYIKNNQK